MATSLMPDSKRPFELEKPCLTLADHGDLGVTLSVPAGKTIVIEGDPITHYFLIVSGSVRLYKSIVDGRRQIIDFLGSNDCFGLIGSSHHTYSVEAINDVNMIRYSKRCLDDAIDDEPELTRQLFRLAASQLDQAQRRMLLLGRMSAEERLASFLIDLAERQATACLHIPMTRQDIADYLGLTIETVSRLFSRFKRTGLIDLPDRHAVILQDSVRLSGLADGGFAT